MSKRTFTLLGTTMLLGAVGLSGCQSHHPITMNGTTAPRHEVPGQDWWSYQFAYFPGEQVYFEPYTGTYFWYDQGLWDEGPELPDSICLNAGSAVVVKLQNQKPYAQHGTVSAWHHCYWGPLPGSTAAYHGTTEAIAQSELRAAIRMASTLEELIELSAGMTPVTTEPTDATTTPVEQSIGAVSPAQSSGAEVPATMFSGASESNAPSDQ